MARALASTSETAAAPPGAGPPGPLERRPLLALVALCLPVYALGLAVHGLTNWQEAQRLLVAIDMHAGGRWLVPTVNGTPYLAKPPLIYWLQLLAAGVLGGRPTVLGLRLVVAAAAIAGVLLCDALARTLAGMGVLERHRPPPARVGLLSGACLATGVLYVRSGRIGELDILLAPAACMVALGVALAWGRARRGAGQHPAAVALACAGAALGTLAKGPPALLVTALICLLAPALAAAWQDGPTTRRRTLCRLGAAAGLSLGCAAGLARAAADAWAISPGGAVGLALLALSAAAAGALLAPIARGPALKQLWTVWRAVHPWLILAAGVGAFVAWGKAVEARIGPEAVAAAAGRQAAENLRLWEPDAILKNLEAASYAVGLGSVAAIAALVAYAHLRRTRAPGDPAAPGRLGPGGWLVVAWLGGGLLAFGTLGGGIARYLTPLWPAIAILAGYALALGIRARARPTAAVAAVLILLGVGQGLWYGYGRERFHADRSPRDLIAELLRPAYAIAPPTRGAVPAGGRPLFALDIWHPAADVYAGFHVQPYADAGPPVEISGVTALPLATLADRLRRRHAHAGPDVLEGAIVLYRARPHPDHDLGEPLHRLAAAGLVVQTLPLRASWTIDNGRTPVHAALVTPAER